VAALVGLKRDTVKATALELSEAHALLLAFRLERNRARSVIEEAWLLRELVNTHATPQNELAALLGRSASWVSRRLALVEVLPEVAEQAVRRGVLPAQAAMKYLVPLARANRGQCEGLVTNLESRRLSVREMARLYAAWRAGNAAQREAIVAHPLLYLEMEEKLPESPLDPATEREQRLVRDLGALSGLCRRTRQALKEREKGLPWPAVLRFAWQEAQASFAALIEVVVEGGPFDMAQDRHA
jgi:ParB-like chromosome segregation protein Spo0J